MNLVVWTSAPRQAVTSVVTPVLQGRGVGYRFVTLTSHIPELVRGDVLLCLGTEALILLQKEGLLPKNRAVTSMRGRALQMAGHYLVVSYDPRVRHTAHALGVSLEIDIHLACRIALTGSPDPVLGEYRYVRDFGQAIAYVHGKYKETGKVVPLSLDLETVGLDPYNPDKWIVSCAVTVEPGHSSVLLLEGECPLKEGTVVWKQIHWMCNSPYVGLRGANLKFDAGWLKEKLNIPVTRLVFDTTIVGSLLDENRSNSLGVHSHLYTGLGGYDAEFNHTHDKSRMDLVATTDPEGFLIYAGGDTDACYQVADAQKHLLLQDGALARFYVKLLRPATEAFAAMERVGVLLDIPYYEELEQELNQVLRDISNKAYQLLPPRLKRKYQGAFALTRPAIIADYLFSPRGLNLRPLMMTPKGKAPSTAWEHLQEFLDHEEAAPFIRLIKEHNTTAKTLSTYVIGFRKHLRADGRLHPTAILWRGSFDDSGSDGGTVTGRLSFRDPAIQTTPKHTIWAKPLRKGYVPPPGFALVNWDFSQGELRIAADRAQEQTMIRAYQQGLDLHMVTGGTVNDLTLEEMQAIKETDPERYAPLRQGGKAGNFGLIYGMQASGYQKYARNTYGVHITGNDATAQRDRFFEKYPGLLEWHTREVAFAKQHLMVRSPLGRVRHLPLIRSTHWSVASKAERQAINAPVQSTLSDMILLALVTFREEYGDPDSCQFCMMTHDALAAYVAVSEVGYWGGAVKDIMENLPLHEFDWEPSVSFDVDVEVGYEHFGDMASMQ